MQTEPPKAEPPKRKRRWFQFSLRSLMIGVAILAVICGYVGRQAKVVRDRKAYLQANTHDVKKEASAAAPLAITWTSVVFAEGDKTQAPNGIRIWLGDKAQDSVWMRFAASEEERLAVAALFPEADILVW
jgi:hypothetical protein